MSVYCNYCVLSGRGHSSRGVLLNVVCVAERDGEASTMRKPCPKGLLRHGR